MPEQLSLNKDQEIHQHSFPKIIHIIYNFWSDKTPKEVQKRIDKWKNIHPDYQHIRWNKKSARDFIKQNYDWFLPIYDSYPYQIQRCDALRYFILFSIGGIYTDIDLEPVKNLDSLLKKYTTKDCLLYRSVNSNMITNDFMVSKPNNPFFKKVWHSLILNSSYKSFSKQLTVMYTTGPLMLDKVYEDWNYKKKNIVCIIPTKLVNSCDIAAIKPCYNKEAYLKRYHGSSWHSVDSTIINFMYTYWIPIIIIISLVIGYILLFYRHTHKT